MEQDRFKNHHKLYIVGIICLVLSLTFFFFSMYIIPYLIWELDYDVPDMIIDLISLFEDEYDYGSEGSKFLVWLIFFVPCLITGFVSYFISNYIDNDLLGTKYEEEKEESKLDRKIANAQMKESASLAIKIIFLMILIVAIILLLQVFIQATA